MLKAKFDMICPQNGIVIDCGEKEEKIIDTLESRPSIEGEIERADAALISESENKHWSNVALISQTQLGVKLRVLKLFNYSIRQTCHNMIHVARL